MRVRTSCLCLPAKARIEQVHHACLAWGTPMEGTEGVCVNAPEGTSVNVVKVFA